MTRAQQPEHATLTFMPVGHERQVVLRVETGSDGVFDTGPFAPGAYVVRAGLAQLMEGGASATERRSLDVVPGRTAAVDLELASGALIIVQAPLPDGAAGTLQFFLARGTVAATTAADLEPAVHAGTADAVLFGGSSLGAPMQFHDRAPGTCTLCVEAKLATPKVAGFICQPLTIAAALPVVDVTVMVPLA